MSKDVDSDSDEAEEGTPTPNVLTDSEEFFIKLLAVKAGADQVRPGWWPSLIAVAMVGLTLWWIIADFWYPLPYLAVTACVCLLLSTGWWLVSRRDHLNLFRMTVRTTVAMVLWVGFTGAVSIMLASFFANQKSDLFPPARSGLESIQQAFVISIGTSVIEETTCAVVVLAVAALTALHRPLTGLWPWVAITSGAAVRVLLHIPLWGNPDALIRSGFALVMGWLFWKLRRIWPLIIVHFAWDVPQVLSLTWPAKDDVVALAAVAINILWILCGLVAFVLFAVMSTTGLWRTWRTKGT